MAKRRSKNTEKLKSITSQLETVKEIQAGQEEAGVAAGESIEVISSKVTKIVGVLARNAARVKTVENRLGAVEQDVYDIYDHVTKPEEEKAQEKVTEDISSIGNSMANLAMNLGAVENLLIKSLEGQRIDEYKKEEALLEAKAPKSAPVAKREASDKGGSFTDLLKSFFTNPAVIAAFSGIAYLLLPKDVKEKIGAFFSGLTSSGEKTSAELSTFEKVLIGAAGGLATYLGASVLKSVGDALTTVMALIAKAKTSIGSLKKKGLKGVAKGVGEAVVKAAPTVAIGAGAAIGAGVAMAGQDKKEEKPKGDEATVKDATGLKNIPVETKPVATQEVAPTPAATPAPTPTTPAQPPEMKPAISSPLKIGRGEGLKPGGGVGIRMPDETVGDAIKTASKRVGVDESIMLAMAKQESGFNPGAKAGTSSAKGLYQFIDATWGGMVKKYGGQYPELNRGPMDPLASAIAGALYIKENSKFLEKNNIPVNGTNIYASHFLGAGGARTLLTSDPNAIAADVLPQAAAANKPIFYDKSGNARSINQVIEVLYGKVGKVAEQYAAALTPAGSAEPTVPASGIAVAKASEGIEAASTARATNIQTNVAGGSSVINGKRGQQAPREIPNPVASRGSLNDGVKFTSAYS